MNNTVYDKAKYHYDGDFPEDLPLEHAYIFTGFFLGWIVDHEMYSEGVKNQFSREIDDYKQRRITGPQLYRQLGGVLAKDVLNDIGNEFANYYYTNLQTGRYREYLYHFMERFDCSLSIYHVEDTWDNYFNMTQAIVDEYEYWIEEVVNKGC
jgi:hypothetical protein